MLEYDVNKRINWNEIYTHPVISIIFINYILLLKNLLF